MPVMGTVASVVAGVVGVASAVTGIVGGIMQSQSQKKQALAAQKQGEAQANVARENAKQVQVAAQLEQYQQRRKMGHILGMQRAAFGASGVTMEGTPLVVLEETAYEGELENTWTQYKADQQSQRWKTEAENYEQAGEAMASTYKSQAGMSILTGVATGVGRAVSAFDSYQLRKFSKRDQ